MEKLEDYLMNTLYRATCPSTVELGEYALNLLDAERAKTLKQHLSDCRFCTDELKTVAAFQKELASDMEMGLLEQVKLWIAERLPDFSTGGGLSPAVGVRGDIGQILAYQAGDAQLSLTVQEDPQQPDRRAVLGLLIGASPEAVRVNLFQRDRLAIASEMDDLGNFVIEGIKPGQYELTLHGSGFEIYVSPLSIQ